MTTNLRTAAVTLAILSVCSSAFSQRPSDPALLVPQDAPPLEYVAVPDPLPVPAGTTMGAPSSVAFDAKGHLFVATRGTHAFFEFDPNGKFVRAFGEGLLTRSHGLHIDREGNIWVTDVGAHVVLKLSPQGQVLLTLGVKGEAGEWNEAAQSRRLNQPNDVVIARNGDIFVAQGHTPGAMGDPRVLRNSTEPESSSRRGAEKGRNRASSRWPTVSPSTPKACSGLSIARISASRFSMPDGKYIRELKYAGVPLQCSRSVTSTSIWSTVSPARF